MNIAKVFSGSRSPANLISRMGTIVSRFGLTSGRFERLLDSYSSITTRAGCIATLPITAVILKRHPRLIRQYNQKGIEFAIHGYLHIDYQKLTVTEQIEHFKKAVDTFNNCEVPFTGFRAPYLRVNNETPLALSSLNFLYDSSDSIYWNVLQKSDFPPQAWSEYLRLFDYYQSHSSQRYLSLPRCSNGSRLIEIPVSIPDDEAMVERLGIIDEAGITQVWSAILKETYNRGELFTLQLHPERILLCGTALTSIIRQAKELKPPVWVTTLKEIARWWQEKERFVFKIQPYGNGKYTVKALCSEKATILIRNCRASFPVVEWKDGYQRLDARYFVLESPRPPVIGAASDSSPEAVQFLRSEGFIVEINDQPERYGLYFNNLQLFQQADEKRISDIIERSDAPLVRFWRWPDKSRSALTVSGDIDSITLLDFGLRLLEARQKRKRIKCETEVAGVRAPI